DVFLRAGRAAFAPQSRRIAIGVAVAAVGIAACVLVARRVTDSSWPLAHARPLLVAAAAGCYFASFVLRACGWQRLFPRGARPGRAGCLASVGAASASGYVLPFRLDYLDLPVRVLDDARARRRSPP